MNDEFEGKTPIKNIGIFKSHMNLHNGNFRNCVFSFPFSDSDSELLINALKNEASNFEGSIFTEDVTFNEISITQDIVLSRMKFKKSLIFDSVKFSGNLEVDACTFNNFEFLSSQIHLLGFAVNNFLGKIKVSKNNDQQIKEMKEKGEIKKVKIANLVFMNNTVSTEGLVRFGYLDVDFFYFENMSNPINSETNIGECNFKTFLLRNLRNNGKCRIYKINTKKTKSEYEIFELKDSSLGDSEFQNVNLACYKTAIVQDNLLSGLQYTSVQWPDNIEIAKIYIDLAQMKLNRRQLKKMETNKKKRDTYRTLKNVAQKNNDAPQAIEFYAEEMKAYSRTLSWKKGERIDVLILWINRWTNDFGLNWVWPIGWILATGAGLYALLLWSCSDIDSLADWKKFFVFSLKAVPDEISTNNFDSLNFDGLGKFFVFLNPAHKIEFVFGENWQPLTYFFDFAFRVIEATLIYQTIIAFRKFTRKL